MEGNKKLHFCSRNRGTILQEATSLHQKKGDNEYNYQSLRISSQTHMLCVIAVKILVMSIWLQKYDLIL